jgi:outer membrane protein assembly factor BamB
LSKENTAGKTQEMVKILAESLQPTRAAKLSAKTPEVPASTRIVCTEILEQIHQRMWKLAYERYPKELKNVITQTDRWTYPDPLADSANRGFSRRLKSLSPLTGDFVALRDSYFSDDGGTLVRTENICGYPVSVKHRKVSEQNAHLVSYFSKNQKAKFELMIVGSKELREDVTDLLLETLKSFFALEFLFDVNSIYGIDLTDSLKQIQQENTKYASRRRARRMLTARDYRLCGTGWPAPKKDARNSGFVVGDTPAIPLKLKWEKRFDGKSLFIWPVVDDEYLYLCFGDTSGSPSVYILDRKSGERIATIPGCNSVNTTPVVGEKCLYVSWNERIISAYEKRTWKEKWRAYLPDSHQYGPMTLADGVLVCASKYGYLSAIDALDGTHMWNAKVSTVTGLPFIDGGKIIYGDKEYIVARSLEDGREIWRTESTDGAFGYRCSLAGDSGRVFGFVVKDLNRAVNGYLGHYCGFDAEDGRILWKYRVDAPYASSSVCNSSTVLVGDKNLTALDMETGRERWTIAANGVARHFTIITGNYVISAIDGNICVIGLDSGEILDKSQLRIDGGFSAGPAYYDGFIYIWGNKGIVQAYN